MKILSLGILLLVLATGSVFAESNQRVATDAEILLGQQVDWAESNRLFLELSIMASYENRIILNDYRTRFNAIGYRVVNVRHQLTNALNVREPRMETVNGLRRQLQSLVIEHDNLIDEFRQWVENLPR